MTSRDAAALLADPTLAPVDLTAGEAELLAAQVLDSMRLDEDLESWAAAGEVLGRLAPTAARSLVFVALAQVWVSMRVLARPGTGYMLSETPPPDRFVKAMHPTLIDLGWIPAAGAGDPALKARQSAHESRRAAALEDPEGFAVPADAEDWAVLAVGMALATVKSVHVRGNALRVLDRLGESGGSEFLAAVRRVLEGLPVAR